MLEQMGREQVLEAQGIIALDETGVMEVDLRLLQDRPGDVPVPGPDQKDDEQRLEDVEVAADGGLGDAEVLADRSQRQR